MFYLATAITEFKLSCQIKSYFIWIRLKMGYVQLRNGLNLIERATFGLNVDFLLCTQYLSLLFHMPTTPCNQYGSTSIHTDPLCLSNHLSLTQCSALPRCHLHISQRRPPADRCTTGHVKETRKETRTYTDKNVFVCALLYSSTPRVFVRDDSKYRWRSLGGGAAVVPLSSIWQHSHGLWEV